MSRIAKIETFRVPPRWLFVRVETDNGAVGWGEGSLEGHAEAVEGAFGSLRNRFVGADPAQIEDVAAAFAWVKRHVAEKRGDPERVFLMGHSSGAHLSLLLVSDPKYLAKHGLSRRDIAGVVGLSSPVDLEPRGDRKGFGDVLMAGRGAEVFSRDVEVMRDASPIRHVSKGLPPMLLVVGGRDFPMLEGDARAFIERARGLDLAASLFVAKDFDHMGVVRSLVEDGSPVWEQVSGFLNKP